MSEWIPEDDFKNSSIQEAGIVDEKERSISDNVSKDFVDTKLLDKAEGVAIQVCGRRTLYLLRP